MPTRQSKVYKTILLLQIFIEFCAGGAVDDIIIGELNNHKTPVNILEFGNSMKLCGTAADHAYYGVHCHITRVLIIRNHF